MIRILGTHSYAAMMNVRTLALASWSSRDGLRRGYHGGGSGLGAPIGRFYMSLDILEVVPALTALAEHATIPIAYVVDRILQVRLIDGVLGGMSLTETAVSDPYVKDYHGRQVGALARALGLARELCHL